VDADLRPLQSPYYYKKSLTLIEPFHWLTLYFWQYYPRDSSMHQRAHLPLARSVGKI